MAVLVVLVFAELAGQFGQASGELFFLLVAPLLPSAAVAFSYDPDLEPALRAGAVHAVPVGAAGCSAHHRGACLGRFRSRCCSGSCCPGRCRFCGCCRLRDSWRLTLPCRRGSVRYAAWPSSAWGGRRRSGSPRTAAGTDAALHGALPARLRGARRGVAGCVRAARRSCSRRAIREGVRDDRHRCAARGGAQVRPHLGGARRRAGTVRRRRRVARPERCRQDDAAPGPGHVAGTHDRTRLDLRVGRARCPNSAPRYDAGWGICRRSSASLAALPRSRSSTTSPC